MEAQFEAFTLDDCPVALRVVPPPGSDSSQSICDDIAQLHREDLEDLSFKTDLATPFRLMFLKFYFGQINVSLSKDGGCVISDFLASGPKVFQLSQFGFLFDQCGLDPYGFLCDISVFAPDGTIILHESAFACPQLAVFPIESGCFSPYHSLLPLSVTGPEKNPYRERRQVIDAPESGYCQLCREKYSNAQKHRQRASHITRGQDGRVWAEFDAFAASLPPFEETDELA
jgi:hypothetical protein